MWPVSDPHVALQVPGRPAWHSRAACRGMTDLFFHASGRRTYAAARAVCAGCPVRAECLAEGLELEARGPVFGVRAGLAPRQRRALRRR
jgi:Transcription factor WhiB